MIASVNDVQPSVDSHLAKGKTLHGSIPSGSKADEFQQELNALEHISPLVVTSLENSLNRLDYLFRMNHTGFESVEEYVDSLVEGGASVPPLNDAIVEERIEKIEIASQFEEGVISFDDFADMEKDVSLDKDINDDFRSEKDISNGFDLSQAVFFEGEIASNSASFDKDVPVDYLGIDFIDGFMDDKDFSTSEKYENVPEDEKDDLEKSYYLENGFEEKSIDAKSLEKSFSKDDGFATIECSFKNKDDDSLENDSTIENITYGESSFDALSDSGDISLEDLFGNLTNDEQTRKLKLSSRCSGNLFACWFCTMVVITSFQLVDDDTLKLIESFVNDLL